MLEYLLLAGGQSFAIQLAEFQMREESLNGGTAVAVRRGVHYGDLHLREVLADFLAGVVRRVVDEDDRVIFPARSLNIKLLDQMPHEEHEGVLVGGCVAKREIDSSVRVQGGDHGEGRADWPRGDRGRGLGRAPHLPSEVRLVDVDHAVAGLKELEHGGRVLLSEDQASLAVDVGRVPLVPPVLEAALPPHDRSDLRPRHLEPAHVQDFVLDEIGAGDRLVVDLQLLYGIDYCDPGDEHPLLGLLSIAHLGRPLLGLDHQIANKPMGDAIEPSDVRLSVMSIEIAMNNLLHFEGAEFATLPLFVLAARRLITELPRLDLLLE